MRATIDEAGRVTLPEELREQAGLEPGMEVELRWCCDHLEAEPGYGSYHVERRGMFLVAVCDEPGPPLTVEQVNEIIDELRLHPFGHDDE